jgi:hypothetical protein
VNEKEHAILESKEGADMLREKEGWARAFARQADMLEAAVWHVWVAPGRV